MGYCKKGFLTKEKDFILGTVVNSALEYFLRSVDCRYVQCILLTGSLARDEATIIRSGSHVMMSDLDFIVFVKTPYYFIAKRRFREISKKLTETCQKRGVKTRILFHPQLKILQFLTPKIYLYEYRVISKLMYGEIPDFVNRGWVPTAEDALDLIFSSIADYISVKSCIKTTTSENIYVYAKRSLTILYSILIIERIFVYRYSERVTRAIMALKQRSLPIIDYTDLFILDALTRFKLSGSIEGLKKSLQFDNIFELLNFLDRFFKTLTIKVLYYCLALKTWKKVENDSVDEIYKKLPKLLVDFVQRSKLPYDKYVLNILSMIVCTNKIKDKKLRKIYSSFCIKRYSIRNVINLVLTYYFLDESSEYFKSLELQPLKDILLNSFKQVNIQKLIELRESHY